MTGKVIWFNRQRGYGFIKGEDGRDYFAHQLRVQGEERRDRNLFNDQEVTFEVATGDDGREVADHIVPGERPARKHKESESV